jgi:hypothetical protein
MLLLLLLLLLLFFNHCLKETMLPFLCSLVLHQRHNDGADLVIDLATM